LLIPRLILLLGELCVDESSVFFSMEAGSHERIDAVDFFMEGEWRCRRKGLRIVLGLFSPLEDRAPVEVSPFFFLFLGRLLKAFSWD